MSVLGDLNKIKEALDKIRDEAVSGLDQEVLPEFLANFDGVQEQLNRAGAVIEKHYGDKDSLDIMKVDMKDQMKEDPLYRNLSDATRDAIIDNIIGSADKKLASKEDLKKFIAEDLRNLDAKELVTQSYTKDEIIRLGRPMVDPKASDGVRYNAALKTLIEMAETPQGFEDAVAKGEEKILKMPKETERYLLRYYGV
jgi:hypothetical protein